MSIDFQTIMMIIILMVIVIINFLIFLLYLAILFKYIYLPKKIDFKGFINRVFKFFTFGYVKLPDLLLNISNFFAVVGTIFLIAILMFILINIIILGPISPLFPFFSEPIKIAVLFIVFFYGFFRVIKYIKSIEGFQGYNNANDNKEDNNKEDDNNLESPNDLNSINSNRLITLEKNSPPNNERLIPARSKDINVPLDKFKNKNNIENYEGINVKMYSNIY